MKVQKILFLNSYKMFNNEIITTLLSSVKDEIKPNIKHLKPDQFVLEFFSNNDFMSLCLERVCTLECRPLGSLKRMSSPLESAYR